jgi:hypothetical protein
MQALRRLFFAVLIAIGGVLPALAQGPPPAVPVLPDTERRTTYTLTAQTGPFPVNFAIYGDGSDYQDWITVWLNGALVDPSTYTFTSSSGSLTTLPRPITNAQITFNNSTTGTVQIVGARRPRRTSQFTQGKPVAARDLNQIYTDIVAVEREIWDKTNDTTGRILQFPAGETFPLMPNATGRLNSLLGFDAAGSPSLYPTTSSPFSIYFLQSGTGAVNRTMLDKSRDTINAKDFGAVCDGTTNDATAIQAAITQASSSLSISKTVVLPAGVCKHNSTLTIAANGVTLQGAGKGYQNLFPTATGGTKLLWGGGASPQIIFGLNAVGQPTFGGGIKDVSFDGGAVATYGIEIKDATYYSISNVQLQGQVTASIWLTNTTNAGTQFPTAHGSLDRISISLRGNGTDSAHGILCDGVGSSAEGVTLSNWTEISIQHANGDGIHVVERCDAIELRAVQTARANSTETGIGLHAVGDASAAVSKWHIVGANFGSGVKVDTAGSGPGYGAWGWIIDDLPGAADVNSGITPANLISGSGDTYVAAIDADGNRYGPFTWQDFTGNWDSNTRDGVHIFFDPAAHIGKIWSTQNGTSYRDLWIDGALISIGATNGTVGIGVSAVTSSFLKIAAGTTAKSQIRLTPGVAPTSPVDGDVWYDGTNYNVRQSTNSRVVALNGVAATTVNGQTCTLGSTCQTGGIYSASAPTIASGFCSTGSPVTTVSASNGTAAFDILIGAATCGSTGTLTMPAATTGWVCSATDVTTPAGHNVVQTGTNGSTTAVVLTDYSRTAGTAQNFLAADHIHVMCSGY